MKDRSSIRAALAVLLPVAALTAIGWGVAVSSASAVVVGSLVWVDFWAARVGKLIRLLKFGQLIKKQEDAE